MMFLPDYRLSITVRCRNLLLLKILSTNQSFSRKPALTVIFSYKLKYSINQGL